MSVLFITIGQRDVQYVFEFNNKLVRFSKDFWDLANRKAKIDMSLLKYVNYDDIDEELRRDDAKEINCNPIGLVFPMLDKTESFLRKEKIDQVFIISTYRKQFAKKLDSIMDFCIEKDWMEAATLTDDILFHSKKDITSDYSDLMEKCIMQPFPSAKITPIKIGKDDENILDIFSTDLRKVNNENELIKLLTFLDFNSSQIIYPNIYNSIINKFDEISNKDIYLSIAGGMPIMHRALETIIRRTFKKNKVRNIIVPEKDSFRYKSGKYTKKSFNTPILFDYISFFEIRDRLTSYLDVFDFKSAFDLIKFIERKFNIDFSKPKKEIAEIIDDLNHQSNNSEFIQFYLRILSAIYTSDYINLSIYLKALQEQTQKVVLQKVDGVEYQPKTNKNEQFDDLIIVSGKQYEVSSINFWNENRVLWEKNEYAKLYVSIFLDKNFRNRYFFNHSFIGIKKIRNNFIHKGVNSLSKNQDEHFFKFLGIDKEKINSIVTKIRRENYDKGFISFEKNYFGQEYTLHKIAKIWGEADNSFEYRIKINEIITKIYQTELK